MTRRPARGTPLLGLALFLVLAGCGATATKPGSASATSPAAKPTAAVVAVRSAAAAGPVAVAVAAAAVRSASRAPRAPSVILHTAAGYGQLLVDGQGRTLYLFTADGGGTSHCAGACAAAWPPLLVGRALPSGRGVRNSRLSVIHRAGGQLQLAYYGHPLYRYVGDRQPGQINCQDAEEFGGHWWLVKPDGQENRRHP